MENTPNVLADAGAKEAIALSLPPSQPAVDSQYLDDAPEFTDAVKAILARKVDPSILEVRPTKNGEGLLYAPWVHYQQVLFDAFGVGGYRLVPTGIARTVGNVKTWPGALFVRAPGQKKFQFIKSATGECNQHAGMTEGNAIEGAQSDCLTKCCKGLGIFMELFDPRYRRWWHENEQGKHEAAKMAAKMPTKGELVAEAQAGADKMAAQFEGAKVVSIRTADTGEAPTQNAIDGCRGLMKKLGWKAQYAKLWLNGHFGLSSMDAATARQAENAYILLSAFGKKELYENALAEMVRLGEATSFSEGK